MRDYIKQFTSAIESAGLTPPDQINDDGTLYRFSSDGRKWKTNGWYVLHGGDFPAGAFGCWAKLPEGQTWRADIGRKFTKAEDEAYRENVKAMQEKRKAEETKLHEEVAEDSKRLLGECHDATSSNAYLKKKQVQAYGIKELRGDLVIPMRDSSGKLWNTQTIYPDKPSGQDKRFRTGGKKKGCYFSIAGDKDADRSVICIAEGYATAASIREATGFNVAVAFDAGNLEPVAAAIRAKLPDARIVTCADDDWKTEGNPGIAKAKAAAQSVGGFLAVPKFGADRSDKATDFNDLHVWDGMEAVRSCIDSVLSGPAEDLGGYGKIGSDERAAVDLAQPHLGYPKVGGDETMANMPPSPTDSTDEGRIAWLATLSPIEYDRVRKDEATEMGIRPATLDKAVKTKQQEGQEEEGGGNILFAEVEPFDGEVIPADLLDEITTTIKRFIICPDETAHAAALWVTMTWFIDVIQVAPLAVITAPEKGCGKTQLLETMGAMVKKPLPASNITPPALFRSMEEWQPTLLIDEADSFLVDNEELRGILNCGHTRDSAFVIRTVGDDHTPKQFNVWGAKALSGIGKMPDTIMSRSIILEMRKKLKGESTQRRRHAEDGLFDDIQSKLARLAEDHRDTIRKARPHLPNELGDRAQDNWEPLLAIAELAGRKWLKLATQAAIKLSSIADESAAVGNELLADIQEFFDTKKLLKISLTDLITGLCEDSEKSWATYNRDKPITPRQVSRRLKDYGITSKTVRVGYDVSKGFEKEQFVEAFARYLSDPGKSSYTVANSDKPSHTNGFDVTEEKSVTVTQNPLVTLKPAPAQGCNFVTGKNPELRNEIYVALNSNRVRVEV